MQPDIPGMLIGLFHILSIKCINLWMDLIQITIAKTLYKMKEIIQFQPN